MMNTIRGSFWAKALAAVLLTFFGISMVSSLLGIAFMDDMRDFDRSDTYFQTDDCRSILENAAEQIYLWKTNGMSDNDIKYNWDYERTNWSGDVYYEIYDSAGELLTTGFDTPEEGNVGYIHTYKGEDYTVKTYTPLNLKFGLHGVNLQKAIFDLLKVYGKYLYMAVILSAVMAVAAELFLLFAAGHRRGTNEIVLTAVDKIPLDLFIGLVVAAIALLAALADEMSYSLEYSFMLPLIVLDVAAGYVILFTGVMSLTTRLKCGRFWVNTLIWRVLLWCWKWAKIILRKLSDRIFGVGNGFSGIIRGLPLIWKVALISTGVVLIEFILFMIAMFSWDESLFLLLLFVLFNFILLFAVWKLTLDMLKLKKAGERLAGGNLDETVNTEKMLWDFKQHGENLNSIAEGISLAVNQRMKSERLKTELITNVSHDIKTPLTSIVNYVDLLKKEALEGKAADYIAVLDRQSARLKKLTEDLVEASKASTGNITVNLSRTDVGEIARQAAGEYSERLAAGELQLITAIPESPPSIMADGRLLWRIMDNLLNNACKYSQPNTRVYLDVHRTGGKVGIAVKNISRDALNLDPEELTERFVRGDMSRNTEGSGLGLNIARSLTELQNGMFQISIDGDLFKVELLFNEIL
ncbi:MAG: sensor histidine kinase [Oscillospiraceae bacterium]